MIAMAFKFLLSSSRAEMKDLHVQFGPILTVFDRWTAEVGMCTIVKVLMTDARSRVYWDRSEAGMLKAADHFFAPCGLPCFLINGGEEISCCTVLLGACAAAHNTPSFVGGGWDTLAGHRFFNGVT